MEKNRGRVHPLPTEEIPQEIQDYVKKIPGEGRLGKNAPINGIASIAHGGEVSAEFLRYWSEAFSAFELSRRNVEIIILRCCVKRESDYVWGHHIPLAKEAEMTDEEIMEVTKKGNKLPQLEQTLMKATDEILDTSDISESTWSLLTKHFNTRQIVEIFHIVSQYVFFITIGNTFGIELEPELKELPKSVPSITKPSKDVL